MAICKFFQQGNCRYGSSNPRSKMPPPPPPPPTRGKPKPKPSSLFIPAKTIPKRSGQTTVGPRSSQYNELLQEKGGFDKEKLARLELDRQQRGLPELKRRSEAEAQAKVQAIKEAKEAQVKSRAEALARAKAPKLPAVLEDMMDLDVEMGEEPERVTAADKSEVAPTASQKVAIPDPNNPAEITTGLIMQMAEQEPECVTAEERDEVASTAPKKVATPDPENTAEITTGLIVETEQEEPQPLTAEEKDEVISAAPEELAIPDPASPAEITTEKSAIDVPSVVADMEEDDSLLLTAEEEREIQAAAPLEFTMSDCEDFADQNTQNTAIGVPGATAEMPQQEPQRLTVEERGKGKTSAPQELAFTVSDVPAEMIAEETAICEPDLGAETEQKEPQRLTAEAEGSGKPPAPLELVIPAAEELSEMTAEKSSEETAVCEPSMILDLGQEERRFTAEEKGKGKAPTLWEIAALMRDVDLNVEDDFLDQEETLPVVPAIPAVPEDPVVPALPIVPAASVVSAKEVEKETALPTKDKKKKTKKTPKTPVSKIITAITTPSPTPSTVVSVADFHLLPPLPPSPASSPVVSVADFHLLPPLPPSPTPSPVVSVADFHLLPPLPPSPTPSPVVSVADFHLLPPLPLSPPLSSPFAVFSSPAQATTPPSSPLTSPPSTPSAESWVPAQNAVFSPLQPPASAPSSTLPTVPAVPVERASAQEVPSLPAYVPDHRTRDNGDDGHEKMDEDVYESFDQMDFVWSETSDYLDDMPETKHWDGDEMKVSCAAFALKPAYSIHCPLPWSQRIPEWELNDYMIDDTGPDTPFDAQRWNIQTYLANFESTARCKFEHPGANSQTSSNPFAPLQNGSNSSKSRGNTASDFYLSAEGIQNDLGGDRPQWLLSSYGPGKEAPEQLWGGQLEQSPEEMRLHAMTSEAAGNLKGALNDFDMLKQEAMSKIESAYRNPDAAINYIMQALNQRPNRHDLITSNMNGEFAVGKRPVGFGSAPAANANPFAAAQPNNAFSSGTPGFGQPSTVGQAPSAFGQPAAMGTGTGFGQASALSQRPNPFGAPSALGQVSGFGQPSSLGQRPAPFGAPSALGQPSQSSTASPFGQPSQLGARPNPFGAPVAGSAPSASPFSTFANNNSSNVAPSPFAAQAAPSANNAFSQNGQQQATSPFGQPPSTEVSMGSAPTPTTSAFSTAGNSATASTPFGQPAQAAAPAFGQPAQPATNPFGQPAQRPAANPFGQPTQQTATTPSSSSALGSSSQQGQQQHPAYQSYATKNPATGQLQAWKGQPVTYREIDGKANTPCVANADGTFSKIWFPDGPPPFYKDTEPTREYAQNETNVWGQFAQTGKLQLAANGGGGMPLAAPMRDNTRWDF